jgi:hypothetical protein
MRNVKVALWGFGAMGSGMAKVLLTRKGVDIVGVCDSHPQKAGKNVYELLDLMQGDRPEALISGDISTLLKQMPLDICIIATNSFTKEVYPKIMQVLDAGVNVITIAEEMSWPWAQQPELAKEMDERAKVKGVSILGTGINPGMMMDLLAVFLSGCMTQVDHVHCERVNSLSPFGAAVMHEQGIGLTQEAFQQGVSDGTLAGHVGFTESSSMIAAALGFDIDHFKQQMRPIVTQVNRKSPHGFAAAGQVVGVHMSAQASTDNQEKISLVHPQQIEPQMAGVETGDYVKLQGSPPIDMAIRPEVDGGIGTVAMACNMLPFVVAARPGLLTMLDMPVPRCVMGDYREIAFREELHGQ